jgi:hypothetical protein
VLWVSKDFIFPDPKWNARQTGASAVLSVGYLMGYWLAPYLLVSTRHQPSPLVICAACVMYILGVTAMLVRAAGG